MGLVTSPRRRSRLCDTLPAMAYPPGRVEWAGPCQPRGHPVGGGFIHQKEGGVGG